MRPAEATAASAVDQGKPPAPPRNLQSRVLGMFFSLAYRSPWVLRLIRPAAIGLAWHGSAALRSDLRANLSRILGRSADSPEVQRAGRATLASFYDFVIEVAGNHQQSLPRLIERIDGIEGGEAFLEMRKQQRGAILVTAHFGNFEVGLAAMREKEPRVHVVFQRDAMSRFEQLRHALHQNLGIIETPIDDGMASWLALRDALQSDGVVMLQGDRAMPGQRGLAVPFFNGHLELPIGPAKLAMMTGAPLVPVFAVRVGGGRVRVRLDEAIEVPDASAVEPALREVGRRIEAMVAAHPEQWHVLQRAFVEDRAGDEPGVPAAGGVG